MADYNKDPDPFICRNFRSRKRLLMKENLIPYDAEIALNCNINNQFLRKLYECLPGSCRRAHRCRRC